MRTLLCLFQRRRQHPLLGQQQQRRKLNHLKSANASKAQVLVIFAFSVFALAAFMGLAIDAASIYLTHARLKRAVDAAAVSAANDIKKEQDLPALEDAAREVLQLHNVDMTNVDLHVYDCDVPSLATLAPDFYAICPTSGYAKRKLIWVEATQASPLYFMQLLGFTEIPLTTSSISEAAPIDLVIVIDTSESMASETAGYSNGNYAPNDSATGGCNVDDSCYPLQDAKDAAKALVDVLYPPYDKIAVVTYDVRAYEHQIDNVEGISVLLSDDFDNVNATLDSIKLHDDPSIEAIKKRKMYFGRAGAFTWAGPYFNPIFPDDRDGDGLDSDFVDECAFNPSSPFCCDTDTTEWYTDLWDDNKNPSYGYGGFPCDRDDVLDVFDDNLNGVYDAADTTWANDWAAAGNSFSINSTCAGCGIRIAANTLKADGRPNAVWVIVFLSDGIANMTDIPSNPNAGPDVVPDEFATGYCMQTLDEDFNDDNVWKDPWCVDDDISDRYCIDTDSITCPPDSTHIVLTKGDSEYSVYDWTRDMIDDAALTASENTDETRGNDIAIYSIALGAASDVKYGNAIGEELLRYMAAVGDDGDRTTDPCDGIATETSCGQYYYSPDGDGLREVFEDIAGRIYTRITQ